VTVDDPVTPKDEVDPSRLAAVLRMLSDSGDITPMGVRMIRKVIERD
jgi:hypothetical protein